MTPHILAVNNLRKTNMQLPGQFLSVDLKSWVSDTIDKVQKGADWNDAWQETYKDIGGKSKESGKKGCPMNGTKTLFLLGRIKGSNMPYKNPPLREVWDNYSKNGVYAFLSLETISRNPSISLNGLWLIIQKRVREELGEEPAQSNQGGPTVAYKLWHLGLIANP